ncbi:transposase [Methylococcus sp. S2T]|uniref:transposase n=1 Tax=Methylococcus sp. S2T TaxID=3438967 RepID=UPI003EDA5AA3
MFQDSQNVETQYDRGDRSIDRGKKMKERKRHVVVDVLGNLLHVQVHAANLHDTVGLARCYVEPRKSIPAYSPFLATQGIAAPPFGLSTRPWG